jgi:ATP-dependent DNA helicase PIF1
LKLLQFPIRLAAAMTINKSRGQTLDAFGIYLKDPVFSHGQLYVAMSRASSLSCIRIMGAKKVQNQFYTLNIVYREVLK